MHVYGLVRLWMVGACFCVFCPGQIQQLGGLQPVPQSGLSGELRTLSGTVVNSATGEPIAHALVQVFGPQGAAAFSGPDGHFEIPNVPKQPISLSAEKPGYTAIGQNGRPGMRFAMGARQIIQYGPNENNITLKLTPDAGIHGRVISDQGEPVEGIQVRALAEQMNGGRKQERIVSNAMTDENGEYDLDGLPPGTYFLQTQQRPLYRLSVELPAAQLAYPAEFYPDAPDRASAQAVQLQPGQTAEADFTLKLIPTFRITGVLSGFGNGGIFATMTGPTGEDAWTPVQFNPRTGQFTLPAVPAGSWTFTFRANQGNGVRANFAYAEAQLDVKSNFSNVRLALQPVFPIPVNILHAADSSPEPNRRSQPSIQLIPRGRSEGSPFFRGIYMASPPQPQQQTATPDTLEFRDVPPGRYHVSVRSFGPECLDTITAGSTDLTHTDVTVSEGTPPQPITVSLRNDCATVSGTVRTQSAAEPIYVLFVPDSGSGEPFTMMAPPTGQFAFTGIRPDTYHVYAVPDINGLEYTNPEALRGLSGQEITLGANQKATVALDLATGEGQ